MKKLTINAVMVCLAALGVSAPYEVQAWRNAPSIPRTMEGDNVAVVAKTQSSPDSRSVIKRTGRRKVVFLRCPVSEYRQLTAEERHLG